MSEQRVVITVMGADKVGIVAGVTKILSDYNVNIIDISQTILQGIFAMILMVDISNSAKNLLELSEILESAGNDLGVRIVVQHEDIYRFMHRI